MPSCGSPRVLPFHHRRKCPYAPALILNREESEGPKQNRHSTGRDDLNRYHSECHSQSCLFLGASCDALFLRNTGVPILNTDPPIFRQATKRNGSNGGGSLTAVYAQRSSTTAKFT